jgi:hypothetical protein
MHGPINIRFMQLFLDCHNASKQVKTRRPQTLLHTMFLGKCVSKCRLYVWNFEEPWSPHSIRTDYSIILAHIYNRVPRDQFLRHGRPQKRGRPRQANNMESLKPTFFEVPRLRTRLAKNSGGHVDKLQIILGKVLACVENLCVPAPYFRLLQRHLSILGSCPSGPPLWPSLVENPVGRRIHTVQKWPRRTENLYYISEEKQNTQREEKFRTLRMQDACQKDILWYT